MKLATFLQRCLITALSVASLATTALAGQNCEARRPTVDSMRRDLTLAASVAREIEDAIAFANDSPAPQLSSLTDFVYANPVEAFHGG